MTQQLRVQVQDYQQRIDLDSKSPSSFTGSRIRSAAMMKQRPMSNNTSLTIPGAADKKDGGTGMGTGLINHEDLMIQDDEESNMFSGTHNINNHLNETMFKENKNIIPAVNTEEY